MKQFINIGFISLTLLVLITGCDKTKPYDIQKVDALAHFVSASKNISYYVRNNASDSFSVQVGTSDVSNQDRLITFNISSPTGAVAGGGYTLLTPSSGNTVVVKAGTAITTIKLHGNFATYASGKKDTLVFTLAQPSLAIAKFSDTVKVVLQRYCDVVPAGFTGDYKNSNDTDPSGSYGPYKATVVSITPTSSTSANMVIANFSFTEIAPYNILNITVGLDWTDPANFKTSIPTQIISNDNFYGYGPLTIAPNGTGSFSSCDNTFTFNYKLNVSAGSFGNFVTKMVR